MSLNMVTEHFFRFQGYITDVTPKGSQILFLYVRSIYKTSILFTRKDLDLNAIECVC